MAETTPALEKTTEKPKRGGARPGGGRPKGSRDAATIAQRGTLADLARQYTDMALKTLFEVARDGQSEAARVTAASAILDRGYGRPAQAVELTGKDGADLEIKVRDLTFERLLTLMTGKLIDATPANTLPAE